MTMKLLVSPSYTYHRTLIRKDLPLREGRPERAERVREGSRLTLKTANSSKESDRGSFRRCPRIPPWFAHLPVVQSLRLFQGLPASYVLYPVYLWF